MESKYDIFISYKRKSLPTANNLYYRLTTRGYSTFFDLEEMGRDNFNKQLLNYIDNAKDVFIILEEGSLDGCKKENWEEKDWFCHEIAHALEKRKNIIPILIGGYQMPSQDFFPDRLKELSYKNAPEFNFSFFEAYLNKLVEKDYLLSKPNIHDKSTSVFKFYSNQNCQVFKEGKLVCSLVGMSDEPYYLPVPRKGDFRFKGVNALTAETKIIKEHIEADEEKEVEINWAEKPDQEWPQKVMISGDKYTVDLGTLKFNMIRVEGGEMMIGATDEQIKDAENNEHPAHLVTLPTFYIGQFPVTQNLWEAVMGYNKSHYAKKEGYLSKMLLSIRPGLEQGDFENTIVKTLEMPVMEAGKRFGKFALDQTKSIWKRTIEKHVFLATDDKGHYPAEWLTHDEALEFVRRLSEMTNTQFALPTEEEWEYAARGGKRSQGFKYAGSNDIDEVAWYKDNASGTTHPVGEKKPNELGLYDMSGNVWEWTETPAHSYATNINPEGNVFIRRGGSWWHEAKNCRVSKRYASDFFKKTHGLGLRVVIRENIE